MADEQNAPADTSTELIFRVNDLPEKTYRVLPHSPAHQVAAGTLSMWVDLTGVLISGRHGIFAKDASGIGNHANFYIVNSNLTCVMQIAQGEVDGRISVPLPEPNRLVMRHFVYTFGPAGMRLYVDGDFVAQNPSITAGLVLNNQPVLIGAIGFTSTPGTADNPISIYDGKIIEVALFKGQISPGQVSDLTERLPGANVAQPENPTNLAPTPPTNLRSTSLSASSVSLAWDPSSDPEGGVVHYRVYRGAAVIALNLTATSFVDSTVQPSTTYSYQVEAQDPADLVSSRSEVLTLNTPATPPGPTVNQPPSTPSNLQRTAVGVNTVSLSWNASTDADGIVVNYIVRRGGIVVGQPVVPSFNDTGLQPDTEYSYTVQAVDDDGAPSGLSAPLQVLTEEAEEQSAPFAPTGFMALHAEPFRVHLVWDAPTNPSAGPVAYYVVRRDGTVISQYPTRSKIDTDVFPNGTYRYTVEAVDTHGLGSGPSDTIVVTTPDLIQTPGVVDPVTRARIMGLETRMIRAMELMGDLALDFEEIANMPPPGC